MSPSWLLGDRFRVTNRLSLALVLVVLAVSVACGDDPVTDPRRATSCAGLVEAGRATAEAVLDILGERTVADLEAVDHARLFAEIEHILRVDAFTERTNALGCGAAELTRLACTAYQGLSTQARGEAAREFLAPYFVACD